ncbi:MAG: heavy metal-binding domain-containing protein [Candidatus Micrarchaeia archaeon]
MRWSASSAFFGTTIRTRGVLGRFLAGIESLTGGRAASYIGELDKARAEAMEEMKKKASEAGAKRLSEWIWTSARCSRATSW